MKNNFIIRTVYKNLLVISVILAMTSACSVFRAIGDWGDRMGQKMPVKEGTDRCEGKMFCFGGNNQDEQKAVSPTAGQNSENQNYGQIPQPTSEDINNAYNPANLQNNGRRQPVMQYPGKDYDPAKNYPVNRQGDDYQAMHPWEENPEWKQGLPESPIDPIKQDLEW